MARFDRQRLLRLLPAAAAAGELGELAVDLSRE